MPASDSIVEPLVAKEAKTKIMVVIKAVMEAHVQLTNEATPSLLMVVNW